MSSLGTFLNLIGLQVNCCCFFAPNKEEEILLYSNLKIIRGEKMQHWQTIS